MTNTIKLLAVAALCAGLFTLPAPAQTEPAIQTARWFGPDAIVYAWCNDVSGLAEKIQATSAWQFYTAPELQEFMAGARETLTKKTDATLAEFWREMGIAEPPKELPWPRGQIAVGVFMRTRTVMVPDWSKWDGPAAGGMGADPDEFRALQNEGNGIESDMDKPFDPETLPKVERQEPDFQMVAVIEMGDNLAPARKLFDQMMEKLSDNEAIVLQRENVGGTEVLMLKDDPQADSDYDTPMIAFRGERIVVGSSLKYMTQVLRAMETPAEETLADNARFRRLDRTLGASDLLVFVDVPHIFGLLEKTTDEDGRQDLRQQIELLGVGNLTGVGLAMQMPAGQPRQLQVKMLAQIEGEPRGVLKILSPQTQPIRLNRFMARNIASFVTANYDLSQMYGDFTNLVWAMSNMDVATMVEGAMLETGDQAGGAAPVSLKNDVMGQMAAPLSLVMTIEKPLDLETSQKALFAIQARNPVRLDQALARIHKTFVAHDQKELLAEINGRALYALPPLGDLLMGGGSGQGDEGLAFAVADDNFVFGNRGQVEQALRDLGRADLESVSLSPMFQYARRFLPEQAGGFFYEDTRKEMELAWHALQEEIQASPAQPDEPATNEKEGFHINLELSSSSMEALLNELREVAARTRLPQFSVIEKYFGPMIGHFSSTSDGLYFELTSLRPPQE